MKIFVSLLSFFPLICLARELPIDTQRSQLQWEGEIQNNEEPVKGTIQLKKASLKLNHLSQLSGGSFIIDMKSIKNVDQVGRWRTRLERHLSSDQVFHSSAFPEATFKIITLEKLEPNQYRVTGNMSIKDQTHKESFILKLENVGSGRKRFLRLTGSLFINGQKYGITPEASSSDDKLLAKKIKWDFDLTSQSL